MTDIDIDANRDWTGRIDTKTVVERTAQAIARRHIGKLTGFDGSEIADELYDQAETAERHDISKALEASDNTAEIQAVRERLEQIVAAIREGLPALAKVDGLTAALAEARATANVRQGQLQAAREHGDRVEAQLTAANRRADGPEADLRSANIANTAYANENARLRQERDELIEQLWAQRPVVEAAKAWRAQFSKDPITKGPRMAALMNAVDALPKAEVASGDDGPPDYLIWSQHHQSWWGPNRSGYRANPADAGRYTLAAAKAEMTRGCHCCQVPEVPVFAAKVVGKGDQAVRDAIAQATDWTVMAGQANKAYEPPACPACDKPGRHPETCPTVPAEATR